MMDGLDIESVSKEVKILKPKQVEYKIDEVEMSPVENLVSPKIASAKKRWTVLLLAVKALSK